MAIAVGSLILASDLTGGAKGVSAAPKASEKTTEKKEEGEEKK